MNLYCRIILLTLCLCDSLGSTAWSQNQANVWCFGDYAGLDFNSGTPMSISGVQITSDGTGSICDKSGTLLFYTDGVTVWNANHGIMPNGTGLFGDDSGAQGLLIIPQPGNDSLYYIFTTEYPSDTNHLKYSIVNMNLNGGMGDVIADSVNIPLLYPATSRIAAYHHTNGCDIWLVTHEFNTNMFYSYLITDIGITDTVESSIGTIHSGWNIYGQLKISPDGTKAAIILGYDRIIEVFDFDNATGVLSNPLSLLASNYPVSLEFSPDNSKLYVASNIWGDNFIQFDLSAGDSASIQATEYILPSINNLGHLQLGPNGKIYKGRKTFDWLGVVNDPNEYGSACNYENNGVSLDGEINLGILPNFIQSYFNQVAPSIDLFNADTVCDGYRASFEGIHPYQAISWNWNFNDPSSANNTDTSQNPTHTFSDTGSYAVSLIIEGGCWLDTVVKTIYVKPNPLVVDLGNDTSFCYGSAANLDAGNTGCIWLWSTGDTTQTINTDSSGVYSVKVSNEGCSGYDTITITAIPEITVNLGNDTAICIGYQVVLNAENTGSHYLWSTGDTTQSITANAAGSYSVVVGISNCFASDTVNISLSPEITVNLGNDTSVCINEAVTLDAENPGSDYLWSTGDFTQTITVDTEGVYFVDVTNGCSGSDTISVIQYPEIQVNMNTDTTINYGTGILLSSTTTSGGSYSWSPSEGLSCTDCQQTFASPQETTVYTLEVADTNGCISTFDVTINVNLSAVIFIPDIFSPNGDGNNDVLYVRGAKIQNLRFAVYDRWGEKVFETDDTDTGWNGTFRGKPMNPAVFVYYVTGNFENGDEIKMMGNVALVR